MFCIGKDRGQIKPEMTKKKKKIKNVVNTLVDPIDVSFSVNMLFLSVASAPTLVKCVVAFRVKHNCTTIIITVNQKKKANVKRLWGCSTTVSNRGSSAFVCRVAVARPNPW